MLLLLVKERKKKKAINAVSLTAMHTRKILQ